MYSRLDPKQKSLGIDLHAKSSLDETITDLVHRTTPGSIAVGYSMGARLALATALREPKHFSGLVLISVNAGIDDISERTKRFKQDQKLSTMFQNDTQKGFDQLDGAEVFDIDSETIEFTKSNRIYNSDVLIEQLHVLGLGAFDAVETDLIDLRIPVLYITGARDSKYCKLNARYNKKTPFSHHKILDSDHRVPISAPRTLGLNIEWFANHVA